MQVDCLMEGQTKYQMINPKILPFCKTSGFAIFCKQMTNMYRTFTSKTFHKESLASGNVLLVICDQEMKKSYTLNTNRMGWTKTNIKWKIYKCEFFPQKWQPVKVNFCKWFSIKQKNTALYFYFIFFSFLLLCTLFSRKQRPPSEGVLKRNNTTN